MVKGSNKMWIYTNAYNTVCVSVCVMEVTCTKCLFTCSFTLRGFQIYFLLLQNTNDNKCDISIISNPRKKLKKSLEENSQGLHTKKIVTCVITKYTVTLRTPCMKINGRHCYWVEQTHACDTAALIWCNLHVKEVWIITSGKWANGGLEFVNR
jgi:hypothetical protein